MNIAFIRGPFLNPWELQTYLPLLRSHDFRAIGGRKQFYNGLFDDRVRIEKAHVWGERWGKINPRLFNLYNRALSWVTGRSYGLRHLDAFIGAADILHSAETYFSMTHQCLEVRKRKSCKVVATVWENLPHMGELHPVRRARKKRALQEIDGFLAVTETSRRMLISEGAPAERIDVIPMAVDLSHFKPAPRDASLVSAWKLQPEEKVVLFVGRFVPEKGVAELLDAVPEVLEGLSSPVRFLFVGAGPLENVIANAASKYAGRIQIIPFVSYDQLPKIHNMADIFVLPSKPAPKWQEQFGYVLAESIACGKAVVTTRSGSIPDVVGDAAVLVAPGYSFGLAHALIRLLRSDAERARLGEAAKRWAQEQFDAEKNSLRIEAFYQRVLAQHS